MPIIKGKVIAAFGKYIKVYHDTTEYNCTIRGKLLKKQLNSSPVAVGDNVEISIGNDGIASIEKVLPRRQLLSRPDILVKGKKQVIAVNLDQLVIITSTKDPQFKPGLIDRFLICAEIEKLQAAVVINKVDLADPKEFLVYAEAWESAGYRVIFTSALNGSGLTEFANLLKDKSSTLAGHSGVGKSSLLNAIQPQLNIRTKQISKTSGKGVHTTTSVIMHPLTFGGWVADTPGLKVFGLSGATRSNLCTFFPEMTEHDDCRFNDCVHLNEPDCAVKAAVESGNISEFRYNNYKKIYEQLLDLKSWQF
ncbi:MAG: ribosome small subunit-dependent GTPase A [candidate division Zixibacteria bacterium]|nr:ribosome small subunit-dependent GTPase A [candidate division Zixibacteria bacterium]